MSSRDPRIIAVALEDLREETGLWSTAASQTLAAAYQTQRNLRECVERGFHRASVVLDEALQDRELVTKSLSSADAQMDQAETARVDAHSTLEQAQEEVQEATSVLEFWELELEKALAWLARAEARLERAIAEYERARSAVEQAKYALQRAESRYNSCLRDKNRSNCNSEANAVNSAAEVLQSALYRLQLAEAELIAAKAEVAAARARVQCCSQAVHYATEAVRVAREAESSGEQAVNCAERSSELATVAQLNARLAEAKVGIELETAEQMLAAAKDAVSQTDEASARLTTADNAEETAQRNVRGANHEILYRLERLHEFDRADLHTL